MINIFLVILLIFLAVTLGLTVSPLFWLLLFGILFVVALSGRQY